MTGVQFYKRNWPLLFVIPAGIILTFYTNYRAATLSITHDEAIIVKIVQQNSASDIFNFVIPQDHMINTLMMKWSSVLFSYSEYSMRLPNLLAHLVYIIFSILLLRRLKNDHLLIAGFIMLNFNPYLLDFFSIARGYGLTLAWMMVSLYFTFCFVQTRKIISLIFAFIFSIIAVLTVYTLLNYFIALTGLVLMMLVLWWVTSGFKLSDYYKRLIFVVLTVVSISVLLLFLKLLIPLQRVQSESFIFQSQAANFYTGTIRSIVFRSIYNLQSEFTVNLVSYSVLFVYLMALLVTLVLSLKRNIFFLNRLMFFVLVISFFVLISVTLQYQLFNIRFVQNRWATFVVPLIVLTFIGLIEELQYGKLLKIISISVIYVIAGFFILNTVKNCNLSFYLDWKYDASTRKMMQDIYEDSGPNPEKDVKLGILWLFEPSVNYYREALQFDWLEKVHKNGYDGEYDYYYVENIDTVLNKGILQGKTILHTYELSNTILLKNTEYVK
ncbi:MAG: hypothetical protein R6W71_09275 [Bacteroidales bacterium]